MEYIFTLKYQLAEHELDSDALIERLGAAGCDDALIGIGFAGRLALEFTREAVSADVAMLTALADVKRAMPLARLLEASPDFVGLTDVAEAVGVSRQNMRKLMLNHSASFPIPVHDGSTAIWHLFDILRWLESKGGYVLERGLLDVARAAWQVNLVKESRHLPSDISAELVELLDY